MAQARHHAGDIALPAKETVGIRLLESGQSVEGILRFAAVTARAGLSAQDLFQGRQELARRAQPFVLALAQTSVHQLAQPPQIRAHIAQ